MRIINKIESKVPQMPTRKKVAAYARVSMESERLQHSLSAQVSYYSDLILLTTITAVRSFCRSFDSEN